MLAVQARGSPAIARIARSGVGVAVRKTVVVRRGDVESLSVSVGEASVALVMVERESLVTLVALVALVSPVVVA